ncbi:MAG: hypothetical protein JXR63_10450 [Spirochaetales bacterium]|nr:hypothetical protein [Spirochaetales bacterium]
MTFESIARQPEAATQIIKTSESLLYKSYNDLLPLYDEEIEDSEYVIGAAFGLSFGHFIEAYARQPEAKVTLDSVAEQFLGPFSAGHLSPKLIESAKIEAAPYIFQAIARQPEIFEGINEFCLKYLGVDITGLE